MANKLLNKQLLKKWWFWAILLVVVVIGISSGGDETNTSTSTNPSTSTETTQEVGRLPAVNKAEYMEKEGLVAFKDLTTKGYVVTAKYVNERAQAANQDFTEQFTAADVNSCEDRLGYDAYIVSDLTQSGDNIALTLTNNANSNQTCPSGTTNDL